MWWMVAALAAEPMVLETTLEAPSLVEVSLAVVRGGRICRRMVRTVSPMAAHEVGGVWEVSLTDTDVADTSCERVVNGEILLGPFEPGPVRIRAASDNTMVLVGIEVLDSSEAGRRSVDVDPVVPTDLMVHLVTPGRGDLCRESVLATVDERRAHLNLSLQPDLEGGCARGQARHGWSRIALDRGRWALKGRGAVLEDLLWVGPPVELDRWTPPEPVEPDTPAEEKAP